MESCSQEIVLASSPDGRIVAYDVSTGTPLATFHESRSPRRGITTAGRTFVAVSHICPITASGSVHLYNWWASSAFQKLSVPEPVAPLTASPDGFYLFAGGLSGYIYTLSLPSGDILNSFPAHRKSVSCLELSVDGSLLISGGDDGFIVVIPIFQLVQANANDNASKHIIHQFSAHTDSVTAICSRTGPSSSQIISCSLDCRCKFWCLLSGTLLHTVIFPCSIFSVVLDPTETELYAAGSDGFVYKSSLRTKNKHRKSQDFEVMAWSPKHDGVVISVTMVNGGQNLVSAAENGAIWVWQVSKGQVIMALENKMGSISDLVRAKETSHGKRQGVLGIQSHSTAYDIRDLGLAIKQTVDMQNVTAAAGSDMRRAIDMLESAIAMYEKMLELILKEAKAAIFYNKREK